MLSTCKCLYIIIYLYMLCGCNSVADLQSFSIHTAESTDADSSATITLTLWFNFSIYQCTVNPQQLNTEYICDSNSNQWTVIGQSLCSFPEYKMMISNPWSDDALSLDWVKFTDTTATWWSSNSWCIPDSELSEGYLNSEQWWTYTDNLCGSGYSHWHVLCLDNEAKNLWYGCWPSHQVLSFDINAPNTSSAAVTWVNGQDISMSDPNQCTLSPTAVPTKSPSFQPTSFTNNPSSVPTVSPTENPTFSPTVKPTIKCANDSNVVWTVYFDYTLKNDTTSTEAIINDLHNAAQEFISTDVAASSVCTVLDYITSIGLQEDLQKARINASICFNCPKGSVLSVNLTPQDLEKDFIESVNIEDSVLVVTDVNTINISVDVYQKIVDDTTTTDSILSTQNKQKQQEPDNLLMILILSIGSMILLVIVIALSLYRFKKKRKRKEVNNNINLVELVDGNVASTKKDILSAAEKDENTDDEELYTQFNTPCGVTVSKEEMNTKNDDDDSDHGMDEMYVKREETTTAEETTKC